jgi:hypothetical protein
MLLSCIGGDALARFWLDEDAFASISSMRESRNPKTDFEAIAFRQQQSCSGCQRVSVQISLQGQVTMRRIWLAAESDCDPICPPPPEVGFAAVGHPWSTATLLSHRQDVRLLSLSNCCPG